MKIAQIGNELHVFEKETDLAPALVIKFDESHKVVVDLAEGKIDNLAEAESEG